MLGIRFTTSSFVFWLLGYCVLGFTWQCKGVNAFGSFSPTKNHVPSRFSVQPLQLQKQKQEEEEEEVDGGRRGVMFGMMCTTVLSLLGSAKEVHASQTAGEAIRRSAANLPGYGQADVFYPPSFLGKWMATRTILAANPNYFIPSLPNSNFPLTLTYPMRFITVDDDPTVAAGSTTTNTIPKVIADRAFNEQSLTKALLALTSSSSSLDVQTNWNPSNPNVLTLQYPYDGITIVKEIKVTKRATDVNYSDETVSSSEFRRLTITTTTSPIPSITASRILNKWKITTATTTNQPTIEGIELIYQDTTMSSDPMTASIPSSSSNSPLLLCKSKITLVKDN